MAMQQDQPRLQDPRVLYFYSTEWELTASLGYKAFLIWPERHLLRSLRPCSMQDTTFG